MKKLLILAGPVAAALLFCGGAPCQQRAGEEFTSDECGFKVWFPDKPVVKKETDPSGFPITHKFQVDVGEEKSLMVCLIENDKPYEADAAIKKLREIYAGKKWKITGESKVTVGGRPGTSITLIPADGLVMTVRHCFVKNRHYQVLASATKERVQDADLRKFLGSFKLLEEKK